MLSRIPPANPGRSGMLRSLSERDIGKELADLSIEQLVENRGLGVVANRGVNSRTKTSSAVAIALTWMMPV